ncbi:MAG: sporulation protein Cse60 [Candidatus Sumerlaeaceae bacterium]
MHFGPDETAVIKVFNAGDEISLEEKVNQFLEEHRDQSLADLKVEQVEYHSRQGGVEFGLMAVLVMRVKR